MEGFLHQLLSGLANPELKLTVALAIIVGVLVFKPAGLFGRTLVARV
jgi:branched-subunit amino acid ABC-type transport system permease component